jgi:hypothetical protein
MDLRPPTYLMPYTIAHSNFGPPVVFRATPWQAYSRLNHESSIEVLIVIAITGFQPPNLKTITYP